ncbi:nucleotidyltransferase domain-containing protein [Planomicrobium sp. CPCC 101079]|uniref:nucleotidyltransferase domain-containing protein n=1 Tax=Planomicrobium sp. CPCC 101079 TaxID=2599618 RepID=UPI0011B3C7DE|nr:nucleotidyltransferase domain-containing protein [Planomicrobium sp. CPCC 101079]TWT00579.1 nucleotidyltransferase domain-containing protein [Planomicrobium sp. CPCC 101079]
MNEIIQQKLLEIEKKHEVKILYAVESGSRAWGFPSKDSDYDVRFIYIHSPEWYLSIDPQGIREKRDVIEEPINDLLDISGWEVTKALRLFRKNNPPLLEWLRSEIVYYQKYGFVDNMRSLESDVFYPNSMLYHYLNMAKKNYREYLQGPEVKIKKYFYVLRPILACKWIEKYNGAPPISFQELLEDIVPESELKNEVNQLLRRKLAGDEFDIEPRIDVINNFVEYEMERLEEYAKSLNIAVKDPTEMLDRLFRDTLQEVY